MFCPGTSEMKNQSLEVFAIQTEHSLNVGHVIKSYTGSSCLDFNVFRQDLFCWCQQCAQTKIFLGFSDLESLDRKADIQFFHDAQWSRR